MKLFISLAMLVFLFVPQVRADCKSDCMNDYQSEVESCKQLFDEPDDAADLATCINDAKTGYEACIKDCEEDSASIIPFDLLGEITGRLAQTVDNKLPCSL